KRRSPPEHERVEVTKTVRAEADDLAVEDGAASSDRMTDFLRQLGPLLELVPLPGDESRPTVLDHGEGAEAVVLQLEEPVGMVESLREAEQRHGTPRREHKRQSRLSAGGGQRVASDIDASSGRPRTSAIGF